MFAGKGRNSREGPGSSSEAVCRQQISKPKNMAAYPTLIPSSRRGWRAATDLEAGSDEGHSERERIKPAHGRPSRRAGQPPPLAGMSSGPGSGVRGGRCRGRGRRQGLGSRYRRQTSPRLRGRDRPQPPIPQAHAAFGASARAPFAQRPAGDRTQGHGGDGACACPGTAGATAWPRVWRASGTRRGAERWGSAGVR